MATFVIAAVVNVAVGLAISALFPPPGVNTEGPRLSSLDVSQSAYGEAWPKTYGTVRLPTNMIWNDEIHEVKVEEDVGKGMGGGGTQTTYEYFGDFALGICQGPVDKILQVYADGKLIYNTSGTGKVTNVYEGVSHAALSQIQTTSSTGTAAGVSGELMTFGTTSDAVLAAVTTAKNPFSMQGLPVRFYMGTENQLPDALIESVEGVGNVPAHRGLCYMVFEKLPLKSFGNRIPNITAVVSRNAQNVIIRQGPTATSTVFAGGEMDFDSKRRTVWTGSISGTNRWSYDDLTLLVSNSSTQLSAVAGQTMGHNQRGQIYFYQGGGNDEPIRKFDGNSFQQIDQAGTSTSMPINDIQGASFTSIKLMGQTVDFVFTTPVEGGMDIFFDSKFDSFLAAGSFSEITPAGLGNQLAGGDFSLVDSVGGPIVYDSIHQVVYAFQNWTATAPDGDERVLWRIDMVAVPSPGNELAPIAEATIVQKFPRSDTVDGVTGNGTVTRAFYVKGDNSIIFQTSTGDTIKYDLNTSSITARTTALPDFGKSMKDSEISGGVFAFANGSAVEGTFYEVNVNDLSIIRTTSIDTVEAFSTVDNNFFDEETYSITTNKNGITRYFLNRATGGGESLAVIVQDLCVCAGLSVDDIDVTDLTGITVRGFTANTQSSARSHIQALMQGFLFDGAEIDGRIVFTRRGKNPVRALDLDDLGQLRDQDGLPDPTSGRIVEERIEEIEIPRRVSLVYSDLDRAYQPGTQMVQRVSNPGPVQFSQDEMKVTLPIVFNETEAKQVVEQWLFNTWLGRTTFKTRTHWGNIDLDVTDVVTVPLTSGNRDARITRMEIGSDLTIDLELQEELPASFQAISSADNGFAFTQQEIPASSLSQIFFLDIPILQASDASGGQFSRAYFGMNGYFDAWPGGILLRSLDDTNFNEVGFTTEGIPYGTVLTALPAPPDNCYTKFDDVNTITFFPGDGGNQFVSATDLQVLNGSNAALVGKEIIQYVNAVTNADGSITLSRLTRGRLGTDQHIGTHVNGEPIVMLRSDVVTSQRLPISNVNDSLLYKGVTLSHLIQTAEDQRFTYTGADLKPYSPVFLEGALSGTDRVITWKRRTRYNRPQLIGVAPLNEATEAYELDLRHNGTLVRTVTGLTSPTHTYTLADWTADTGLGTGEIILDNPDAETGDMTGWTVGGTAGFAAATSSGTISAPNTGTYFFNCVEVLLNDAAIRQRKHLIDDYHYTEEEIRTSNFAFSLDAFTAQGVDASDNMELSIRWIDGAGATISTDTTGQFTQTADGAWVSRQVTGNIPKAAREFEIEFECVRGGGGVDDPDGAIDDITLSIGTGVPKLEATVYQISEAVGRGFPRTEDV